MKFCQLDESYRRIDELIKLTPYGKFSDTNEPIMEAYRQLHDNPFGRHTINFPRRAGSTTMVTHLALWYAHELSRDVVILGRNDRVLDMNKAIDLACSVNQILRGWNGRHLNSILNPLKNKVSQHKDIRTVPINSLMRHRLRGIDFRQHVFIMHDLQMEYQSVFSHMESNFMNNDIISVN